MSNENEAGVSEISNWPLSVGKVMIINSAFGYCQEYNTYSLGYALFRQIQLDMGFGVDGAKVQALHFQRCPVWHLLDPECR